MLLTQIKPVKGLIIRDPRTGQILNDKGISVHMNSYWLRRLQDGDIFINESKKKNKQDSEVK